MKKKNKIIILILILLLILIVSIMNFSIKEEKICFEKNKKCFNIEVANTPELREGGLMYRDYLDKDKGMFFIFSEENKYSFWMKNTLIPLDIIWIDSNKKVIFIAKNVLPCLKEICESYAPESPALYVLELNSGVTDEINLEIGDKVNFYL